MLKEVLDAVACFLNDVAEVLDVGLKRVGFFVWNGDQFVVHAAIIFHLEHADRAATDHNAGLQWEVAEHQHVGWVAICVQCVWNKAVVARVEHGCVDDAINEHGA